MWKVAVISLALLLASSALAQSSQPAETEVIYQKKTTVIFTPQEVGGKRVGPEGELIRVRSGAKFSSFIKLRTNFRDKMARSVYEL